jgi:hypothetical protein
LASWSRCSARSRRRRRFIAGESACCACWATAAGTSAAPATPPAALLLGLAQVDVQVHVRLLTLALAQAARRVHDAEERRVEGGEN